jgi:hypothetical protein
MAGEQGGKLVRHRCGYQLQAEVIGYLGVFDGLASVVVERPAVVVCYRDLVDGMLTNLCPKCGQPLQLWCPVDA